MEELAYCVPNGIPHSRFLSWEEDDQDKALAYVRDKALVCNGCGTKRSEWSEDRHAFIAQQRRCPGCERLEMERDNVPPDAKGVQFFLVPRALAEAQDMVGD